MQEMDILEKCAYIKGLAEGLNIDNTKPEGKVLNAIIDLLSDITATIADMDDEVATLGDYIEEVDHDLGEVEEYLYEEDDECDCCEDCECDGDCDECDCEGDCDECDCGCDCEETYEIECPKCGDVICFDESVDPAALVCPACGAEVALTADED